jgi:hypothetical protein
VEILMNKFLASVFPIFLASTSFAAAGGIRLVPSGPVDMRSGAASSWRPVEGEENVTAGWEIRTHKDSTAQLQFPDGSRVQINSGSIFAIDKTDTQEMSFSLKLGKIRAAFAGLLSSRVSIHTPTAVCAVRGTVFDVGVDDKNTNVTMSEGVLEVKDNKGKDAVITSEETLNIGSDGMGTPHLLALNDPGSLPAVRPYSVHIEQGRDATRTMLEDMRNRELKAGESQLGKDVVDAFGRRVRMEEYVLRPDTKSFEVLFLSKRENRFDWGHFVEKFHAPIPEDLSQIPAIVAGGIMAVDKPTNWLKSFEFYATNTIDAEKEKIALGDPIQIDFAGYHNGVRTLLWYPSSIDFAQLVAGPGVPGGERVQFQQHQDYGNSTLGLFTWSQSIVNSAGNLALLDLFQLDPTNTFDVVNTGCNLGGETCIDHSPPALNVFSGSPLYVGYQPDPLFNGLKTIGALPSGPTRADKFNATIYPDGSTIAVEKFLVSNDGNILDLANPTSDAFNKEGNYNLEINIKSSLFQGRDIDVLIAPEILRQKKTNTTTPDSF